MRFAPAPPTPLSALVLALGGAVALSLASACAEGDTSVGGPSAQAAGGQGGAPDPGTVDIDLSDGAALYQYHCRSCHSEGGEGSETSPDIRNPVKGYAQHVVRNGRDEPEFSETMAPFDTKKLPAQGLDSILTYLSEAPHPEDGQGLYLRFCRNCHGLDARGGRVDEDLVKKVVKDSDEFLETVRKGHGKQKYDDVEEYMPAWPASELSNEEVAKIVGYVQTLAAESGITPGGDDDDEEEEEDEEEEGENAG